MQIHALRMSGAFSYLLIFSLIGFVAVKPAQAETDFRRVVESVVMLQTKVPATARTSRSLGTQRQGSGVVIDDEGLVLTIGYLIMEADEIVLTNYSGKSVPGRFVAYDHTSGFGLVRALTPIDVKPVELGDSSKMKEKSVGLVVSLGGTAPATPAQVVSRRSFAGSWEYLLDDAIYTMPPHREFGGAALFNEEGQVVGVGSLFVGDAIGEEMPSPGNMFVPTNIVKPILAELISEGRRVSAPHPWLGVYTSAQGGRVFVTRVAEAGPAQKAGIEAGDIVMGVGGKRVTSMVEFYQRVRSFGAAGVDVNVDLLSRGSPDLEIKQITVKSLDRHDWLSKPQSH